MYQNQPKEPERVTKVKFYIEAKSGKTAINKTLTQKASVQVTLQHMFFSFVCEIYYKGVRCFDRTT